MSAQAIPALSRNQAVSRENQLDAAAEARLYQAFRHFWHPVMRAAELPDDEPRRAVLCEEQLVVVRLEGEVCVFNDLCAHRGTALSLGKVIDGGTHLRCPYHGWQYDHRGVCVLAPQRPDLADRLRARVRKYQSAERYGLIWVCLEDEPRFPLPEYPQFGADGFHPAVYFPVSDWSCAAPRRTENFTDLSHFAFVHDGWLGSVDRPEIPRHRVWRDAHRLHLEQDEPVYEPAHISKWNGVQPHGDLFRVDQRWHVSMPLSVLLEISCNGEQICHFFHPTPIAPNVTRNFTVSTRTYGDPANDYDDMVGFGVEVYEQDRPVVESQRPQELPEDLSLEMHVAAVDTFSLQYRQWLLELSDEIIGKDGKR